MVVITIVVSESKIGSAESEATFNIIFKIIIIHKLVLFRQSKIGDNYQIVFRIGYWIILRRHCTTENAKYLL